MTLQLPRAQSIDWSSGSAYIDGAFMPVAEAKIPITDWGYRRSDVTYDVVSVWDGAFFRLDDHISRFRASMDRMRFAPQETDENIRRIVHHLVALTGLRNAYVAVDCMRGRPKPDQRYHPVNAKSYIAAFAIPYVWVMKPDVIERGAHMIIASTPRIPDVCVDARAKNFHWADMTAALFEAEEKGADNPILLDLDGNVTEGPGYNVFCVTNGIVATADRNVLEGISRLTAIDLCREMGLPCEVRKVSADELREADEIFITGTAGGIVPVTRLDNRILGNDSPGPISERLREAYWQNVAAAGTPSPSTTQVRRTDNPQERRPVVSSIQERSGNENDQEHAEDSGVGCRGIDVWLERRPCAGHQRYARCGEKARPTHLRDRYRYPRLCLSGQ